MANTPASIGFPLWLLWMSGRAKNPVLIAVFGIPIFAIGVAILWALLS